MKTNLGELIRRSWLHPYRKGMGPTFRLEVFDTWKTDDFGKSILGYRLTRHEKGKSRILFEGKDFHASPAHSIDSDHVLRDLLGFLTLAPGDTDADYFANYTKEQTEFATGGEAEALRIAADERFGEWE